MMWGWTRPIRGPLLLLLLSLLAAGCTPGGDQGQPSAPSTPSQAVESQAIANLLGRDSICARFTICVQERQGMLTFET